MQVAGARMGSAKYSGLLAKDEEKEKEERYSNMTPSNSACSSSTTPLPLSLMPRRGEEGEDPLDYAGRQLYAIASTSRRQPRKPSAKKARTTKYSPTEAVENGGEEEMEVDKETESPNDDNERPLPIPSTSTSLPREQDESDSQYSDLSAGEEEEEAARALASELNRRRATGTTDSSRGFGFLTGEGEGGGEGEGEGEGGGGAPSENTLEEYFTAHSGAGPGPTSGHTLAHLPCPRMASDTVHSMLETAHNAFQKDQQLLYTEYKKLFQYWLVQMSCGFNVLLYGLGSKRKLLEDFRREVLSEAYHLVVNGYVPGTNVKQILSAISTDYLEQKERAFKSVVDHAKSICTSLLEEGSSASNSGKKRHHHHRHHRELFLIVHNIEGSSLRSENSQMALGVLASSPCVHVLASVDHINAPLIWDQQVASLFDWLWHDVTTYEHYTDETSHNVSLLVKQSGRMALSSLRSVTRSLTPNARGIFNLLARAQLEHRCRVLNKVSTVRWSAILSCLYELGWPFVY